MERDEGFRLAPIVTLIAALVLAVLPLPDSISAFKPAWAALAILYWSLAAPRAVSLFTAFCTGLALDSLSGALIGQHAFALLVVMYIAQKFYLRLRAFPVSQLALAIAALLALYQFLLFWIDGVAGRTVPASERWAPIVSGALLWILIWTAFDRGRDRAPARL